MIISEKNIATGSGSILSKKYPVIAIAGKPNVGKSTLFNRLLKKRRVITDPLPGVTRDPVSSECVIAGRKVILADTGGIDYSKEGFASLVTEKSLSVLENADIVLLMLDGRDVNSFDEQIIEALRRYSDKIFLLINKLDSPEKDDEIWNFHVLGFKKVIGISSEHGRNINILTEEIEKELKSRFGEVPEEEPAVEEIPEIKISIVGKPNTGKSTLLNYLAGESVSIVSDIPGTTRDIIESGFLFRGIKYRIYDTAGIRKKSKVTEDVEYYSVNRAIKSIDDAEVVFLIIDCMEGLTEQDKKIAYQIVKKGRGVVIVLNKWDMMRGAPNMEQAAKERIKFFFPVLDFAPIVPVSAKEGSGAEKLIDTAFKVRKQLFTRIPTSDLNRAIKEWTEDYPVPAVKGIKYKIRYATQPEIFPVRFLLFVNRTERFPDSYVSYIKNKIRKKFRLASIPFEVEIRKSEKK